MGSGSSKTKTGECPTCGAPVSPFVTECPFCGTDVRRRARFTAARLRLRRRLKGLSPKRLGRQSLAERRESPFPRGRGRSAPRLDPSTPYAVGILLIANLFAYLVFDARGDLISDPGALSVPAVKDGEFWRLITFQFLHTGIFELIFNLFLLVLFAVLVEQRYGHLAAVACYLIAGVAGGLVAVAIDSNIVAAGSTVSTFGLMGTWLVMISRPRALEHHYPLGAGLIVVGLLLLYGALQDGIDLWSQVGGLAAGLAFGAVVDRLQMRRLVG